MERLIDVLEKVSNELEARRFDAQDRFEKYDRRQRGQSSGAARDAYREMTTCDKMLGHLREAIKAATELTAKK